MRIDVLSLSARRHHVSSRQRIRACGVAVSVLMACMTPIAAVTSHAEDGKNTASEQVLEEVTVASTPLGGLELPIDRIPGNIQRATSADLERGHQPGVARFLDSSFGSVFINEAQSNPLQPDLQFRGFVASPLLGQPQGIAVYQDGVRINDPFGDIVNWVLVPEGAIASADLIPGSNPVFGLNAIGGALSLHTKNGFSDPGTQAQVMGGSFGRVIAALESGGTIKDASGADGVSYYANVRHLAEDGWRDHSPSEATHLFGDIGWRDADSSIGLSLTHVEADLIGNGPAPIELLAIDRDAIYTYPDRTLNSLMLATLAATRSIASEVELQGVASYRRSDTDSSNGDESEFEACADAPDLVCTGEGELAIDANGAPIPFSPAVDGATINRGSTKQDTYGASLQLGIARPLASRENRFILGVSLDRSSVQFGSSTELGSFNDDRGAIGSGVLVDEAFVGLHARLENWSVFLTNTFAITPKADLTVAARYNDTRITLRDQLGTELDGDHTFSRFNGSAGISWRIAPGLGLYANYGESNRAPSPVELTCADEDDPCALPNAFLSDPALKQVVARTLEVGARGRLRGARWHAGLFSTSNADDILFISAGALTNRGFFDNVGDTRRQGFELGLAGDAFGERLSWFANYTWLQAEFRESFVVTSPHNPAAVDGEIPVRKGARIPGTPEHILAAGANITLAPGFIVTVDMKQQSDQFMRGDEGNLATPLRGYTTFSAGAEWKLNSNFTLFAEVENLLDSDYATFGLYGSAEGVLGDDYSDPRFVSPAAPLSAWLGIRWIL